MDSVGVIEKALSFLLNMRGAQGGQVKARKVMGYIEDLTSSFPLGSALR